MTPQRRRLPMAEPVKGVRNTLAYAEGCLLDEQIVPGSVSARRARLLEPHVAQLNAWAAEVAEREHRRVPSFDPASGGVHAPVLVLLQDPSRVAAYGSRLISRHNNDVTAYNTHATATAAGLPYEMTVHWNVVPWWVGDPALADSEREGLGAAARRARVHMQQCLDLMTQVEVVLLLGRHAQRAWDTADIPVRRASVLRAPHPAAQSYNNVDGASGRRNSELLKEAMEEVARRVR